MGFGGLLVQGGENNHPKPAGTCQAPPSGMSMDGGHEVAWCAKMDMGVETGRDR